MEDLLACLGAAERALAIGSRSNEHPDEPNPDR
jgi:hypothetical protein